MKQQQRCPGGAGSNLSGSNLSDPVIRVSRSDVIQPVDLSVVDFLDNCSV